MLTLDLTASESLEQEFLLLRGMDPQSHPSSHRSSKGLLSNLWFCVEEKTFYSGIQVGMDEMEFTEVWV